MTNIINKSDKLLVIVESPNKVKTLTSILKCAGYTLTTVIASVGHIMTLKDGGSAYNSGIYPDKQFKMNLEVADDKKRVVSDISMRAAGVDKIILATDKDREGELISWSIIKFCKLPLNKCFRVTFHEITPKAVITALENPSTFNDNLVNAGLVRMMSDKLIGYGLSPIGKKYIGAKSIGRCQSVGLKLISDREAEINNFIPELYFNLYLNFVKNNTHMQAKYIGYNDEYTDKFARQADVEAVIANCKNGNYVVEKIDSVLHKESPKAPFCTATFQQEAANRLGLRIKDAMSCAQKLFEGINIDGMHRGLITYMRTDSTEIAPEFIPELENYIKNTFGIDKYVGIRKMKKNATDQDGHEALRVVDLSITPDILSTYTNNNLLIKVYRLIWQRTVAAAMQNATISETIITINNTGHKFTISLKTLASAGYKVIYDFDDITDFSNNQCFSVGEAIIDTELDCVKKFTQPKARYTEASLVKELQQREIGRPSTYATIVETILSPTRGYTKLEDKYIVPTDRGVQLAEYCNRAFPSIINLNYTKNMEASLDKIATGKLQWLPYMEAFYNDLQTIINNTIETGIAADVPGKLCPICNNTMVVRRSRFGRLFYGCSAYPKCNGIISID
jgi:DNA topoisomerase-1